MTIEGNKLLTQEEFKEQLKTVLRENLEFIVDYASDGSVNCVDIFLDGEYVNRFRVD